MADPPIDLGTDALDALSRRGLDVPRYDRSNVIPRIVHIGVGGFHRSHLAAYCDDLAELGGDWGICGIGLVAGDAAVHDALRHQNGLYTLTTRSNEGATSRVVGSLVDLVLAPVDRTPAVDRIAADETAIVSMTVTEAGYDDTDRNRATFDVIAAGLDRRRRNRLGGVTVASCDNLSGNGDAARRCVGEAARRLDPALASWVDEHCTFPNSMVDRITPATTDADRDDLVERFGLVDRWPVVAEPFRQWVIDDSFAAGRPDLERVGVVVTDAVGDWERYKLHLLNAGHSALAYPSALAGIERVDQAMATPAIREYLVRLLHTEAVPTLPQIPGHPATDYTRTVVERFSNVEISDRIARLCIDGTSKIAAFLMPTIERYVELGRTPRHALLAVAAWAHYLGGLPIEQQAADSDVERVRPLALAARDDPIAFVHTDAGFAAELVDNPAVCNEFVRAYRTITAHGPLDALDAAS